MRSAVGFGLVQPLLLLWVGCSTTETRSSHTSRQGEDYEMRFLNRLVGEPTLARRRSPVPDEMGPPSRREPEAEPIAKEPEARPSKEKESTRSAEPAPAIPRDDVRKVIGSHYPEIQTCYQKMLAKNPKFKGRMVLRFLVGPKGNVLKTTIEKDPSNPPSKELDTCLVKLATKWTFPPPGQSKPVLVTSDPFVFE